MTHIEPIRRPDFENLSCGEKTVATNRGDKLQQNTKGHSFANDNRWPTRPLFCRVTAARDPRRKSSLYSRELTWFCRVRYPCQISCREFVSLNSCFALTLVWAGRLPRAKIAWRIVTDAGWCPDLVLRYEIIEISHIYAITWADFCQVSDLLFTS